jgi:hypothetical protein
MPNDSDISFLCAEGVYENTFLPTGWLLTSALSSNYNISIVLKMTRQTAHVCVRSSHSQFQNMVLSNYDPYLKTDSRDVYNCESSVYWGVYQSLRLSPLACSLYQSLPIEIFENEQKTLDMCASLLHFS